MLAVEKKTLLVFIITAVAICLQIHLGIQEPVNLWGVVWVVVYTLWGFVNFVLMVGCLVHLTIFGWLRLRSIFRRSYYSNRATLAGKFPWVVQFFKWLNKND